MHGPVAKWIILAAAVCMPSPASAGTENAECFCLKHKAAGTVAHFGCKNVPVPNKYTPEVSCIKHEDGGSYPVADVQAFETVPDGQPGCHPCLPRIDSRARQDAPRNGDEEEKKP